MFEKILIANRGEIALRIVRACRELGVRSVAVYSEADREARHVHLADEHVCIGPPISRRSYLNVEALLQAAAATGADAVHPGYGYLAENGDFAAACRDAGRVFIGPPPAILKLAGDKIAARQAMAAAGVPTVPGSPGPVVSLSAARDTGAALGYPLLLKAAGGGGGRGIRVCADAAQLAEEYPVARMEARAACGNDAVYIEKCIPTPRHVEFQIVADAHGAVRHLGERECTIQRRYQKLIEEAPAPHLPEDVRAAMGQAAVRAAQAVGYVNAGTVEFLLDASGRFYFVEINARIQVEHPVTEMTTGVDLVKAQIRLAAGARLADCVGDPTVRGAAIECRINAEDPMRGFKPSPGVVTTFVAPGGFGVRVDSHLFPGYEMPLFYDSLAAKLIAWDATRNGAIAIMRRALVEFEIGPIQTTLPLHRRMLADADFAAGRFDTGFAARFTPTAADDD